MAKMKTRNEVKEFVLKHGNNEVALVKGSNGEPVKSGITLHELIEYIHDTGNSSGRHLSGGERNAIEEGDDPANLE